MLGSHFIALVPMLIMLVLSLVFYGRGLVHITTLAYALVLAFVAALNQWELLFFPLIAGTVIIAIILFTYSMVRGNWL